MPQHRALCQRARPFGKAAARKPAPGANPYRMPENRDCRRSYAKDMCQRSLDILDRTVMVPTHSLHTAQEIADTIHNIGVAARIELGGMAREEADLGVSQARSWLRHPAQPAQRRRMRAGRERQSVALRRERGDPSRTAAAEVSGARRTRGKWSPAPGQR